MEMSIVKLTSWELGCTKPRVSGYWVDLKPGYWNPFSTFCWDSEQCRNAGPSLTKRGRKEYVRLVVEGIVRSGVKQDKTVIPSSCPIFSKIKSRTDFLSFDQLYIRFGKQNKSSGPNFLMYLHFKVGKTEIEHKHCMKAMLLKPKLLGY